MNKFTHLLMLLLFAANWAAFGDTQMSFDDFQRLSLQERDALVNKSSETLKPIYKYWNELDNTAIGQETLFWNAARMGWIISRKNLTGIRSLEVLQSNIIGSYMLQEAKRRNLAGLSKENQVEALKSVNDRLNAAVQQQSEDTWSLVFVKPSPQTAELEQKTESLLAEWSPRLKDGGMFALNDLDKLDQIVKQIRDPLKVLPKWDVRELKEIMAHYPIGSEASPSYGQGALPHH